MQWRGPRFNNSPKLSPNADWKGNKLSRIKMLVFVLFLQPDRVEWFEGNGSSFYVQESRSWSCPSGRLLRMDQTHPQLSVTDFPRWLCGHQLLCLWGFQCSVSAPSAPQLRLWSPNNVLLYFTFSSWLSQTKPDIPLLDTISSGVT